MKNFIVKDANQACAKIAYKFSDVSAIYPITPSSPMAEYCDELYVAGEKNLFGQPLKIVEMQSEAGAAGAMHGSLIEGALTTTFTASQGLLLMIPNMFKMAGEQLPAVMHVSARAVASHALSIFGDHSDVMSTRSTGFSYICSNNAQEAQDIAAIAHISAIKSSLPFMHFFDGFRTSHEIQKFVELTDAELIQLLPKKEIEMFRQRALNPQNPTQMGTAQNPDVFFQNREAANVRYNQVLNNVLNSFEEFEKVTGRHYAPFEYVGSSDAEQIVIAMGSACETIEDFITKILNSDCDEKYKKIGLVKVRLYRPFSIKHFESVLPKSVKKISVLDRTKESGALGEPLYLDVVTALKQLGKNIDVVGGRYGLGSKEFDSENVASIYENLLDSSSKNNFTVGINDDVTNLSLSKSKYLFDIYQKVEDSGKLDYEMLFYGLGSDGTVSANKNSIKMIGTCTDKFVQGYFEYDSKKSGSLTVSHLRVSDQPIKKIYEVKKAEFIAIHNYSFLNRFNTLERLTNNGVVLLNTALSEEALNDNLPNYFKKQLISKNANLYIIDAGLSARNLGLGNKINVIMQSAFFYTSKIIPFEDFLTRNEIAIRKTYGRKGEQVVNANIDAMKEGSKVIKVDVKKLSYVEEENELENITPNNKSEILDEKTSEFNEKVIKTIAFRKGNDLPVSTFSADGKVPTDTSKFEKRGIAEFIPCWKKENCIQCGRCALVCPHAAIRAINVKEENLKDAPNSFEIVNTIGAKGDKYRIQVSPLDCTGCGVCANVCPAKNKALEMKLAKDLEQEKENYAFSEKVEKEKTIFSKFTTKGNQFEKPLFQFSGACAGCGETPYIKLATTLFGENMIIANATGCSSIYGGSYPTCPYSKSKNGYGPAWANSLFEDNAEFGLGIALASKTKKEKLKNLLLNHDFENNDLNNLKERFINNDNSLSNDEANELITALTKQNAKEILILKDELFKKSIWMFGGDGWAYDIGYGGLDHVLNSNENVNILVLDTEVYSNTGGQASKSTSRGAVAKFAASGKTGKKKDLGLIAIANQNAYVAKVSMGANYEQTIRAFKEAEEFNGPSLIIAYAPCVAHGINLANAQDEMNRAVKSGYWELYRYNPETKTLSFDSDEPSMEYEEFLKGETRFSATMKANPEKAKILFEQSKADAISRRELLKKLSN